MESFKLWKLPDLPRSLIFSLLDPIYLIEVSFHSKQLTSFLRRYKIHGDKCRWFLINNLSKHTKTNDTIFLNMSFFDVTQNIDIDVKETEDECQKIVRNISTTRSLTCFEEPDKFVQCLERVSRHILSFMKFEKFELVYIGTSHFDIFNSFLFTSNLVKNFDLVLISTRDREKYTEDQIKFLFSKKIDNIQLAIDVDKSGLLNGIRINVPGDVQISQCDWLSFDDFLEMKSRKIRVGFRLRFIGMKSILRIVEAWKTGEKFEKMESMHFRFFDRLSEEELLEEVDKMDGVKILTTPDAQDNQRSVKRSTDGVIAIMKFERSYLRIDVQ